MRTTRGHSDQAAEANVFGIQYWYRGAKLSLGVKSNHAFSMLIEPEGCWYKEETNERFFSKKCDAYDNGSRAPRIRFIEKVDAARNGERNAKGSKKQARHPAFEIMGHPTPSVRQLRQWLNWFRNNVPTGLVSFPERWSHRTQAEWFYQFDDFSWARLDAAEPLDSLALATLVLQQANLIEKHDLATSAELGVCLSLLRLKPELQARELWTVMVSFCTSRILRTQHAGLAD